MRKLYVLCICFLLITNIAQAERKKVGLVLSGGGAKGVAHIGVIKVLEEAGIPIDYIAGTSMGALVGALYAIGYDAHTLDSLVREQDWSFLLSDKVYRYDLPFSEKEKEEKYLLSIPMFGKKILQVPAGFISGQNIYNLFSDLTIGYHDSISFLDLYIPFSAVAANLVNGEEVILDRGNLPLAMRASMAIPGVFAPVSLDTMTLVDGGIANNFPTDLGKMMGADIIIGVDVSSPLQNKDELNTVLDIVNQLTSFLGMQKYEENVKLADLYIKPNIQPYSAASFDDAAIDTLIQRGEDIARSQWDEIIRLKEKIGIGVDERIVKEKPPMFDDDHIYIERIVIESMEGDEENWIKNRINIKENSVVSMEQIYQAVSRLYGTGMYSHVNYKLCGEDKFELTFVLTEKPQGSLNFGFRFDSEEMAAILLNTTLASKKLGRSQFSITGRLSINPYVKVEYSLGNTFIRRGILEYMYKYNDINLYYKGDKANNMTFSYHKGELRFSDLYFNNFIFQVGLRYEYFDFNFFSMSENLSRADVNSEGVVSYFGTAQYETFDRKYYPTKGMSFSVEYVLHTSNGFQYKDGSPFSSLYFNYTLPISFNRRLTAIPSVYGRILMGSNIPLTYQNYMGGVVSGRYFNQQLPFVGINHLELFDNTILATSLSVRGRLGSKHYVTGIVNYAMHDDDFFEAFSGSSIWGGGIKYSYDFLLGPVDVYLNLSDWDKKLGFYFNLGYYF